MNAKTVFSTALVWTAVSLGTVRGQAPGAMKSNALDTLPQGPPVAGPSAPVAAPQQYQLSSWIRGDKYQCCDQVGCDGPVQTELFFRVGPSIVLGNGTIADVLQTG